MPLIRREVEPSGAGWFGGATKRTHESQEVEEKEGGGQEDGIKVEAGAEAGAGAGGRVSGGLADVTELAGWRHDPTTLKAWPPTYAYSTWHHEQAKRRRNQATVAAHPTTKVGEFSYRPPSLPPPACQR